MLTRRECNAAALEMGIGLQCDHARIIQCQRIHDAPVDHLDEQAEAARMLVSVRLVNLSWYYSQVLFLVISLVIFNFTADILVNAMTTLRSQIINEMGLLPYYFFRVTNLPFSVGL